MKPRHTALKVRRRPSDQAWELVHPRCALERTEDLLEVEQMIAAGENDVATDELRWLLQGCSDCVRAHRLLGELALTNHDVTLARAHFGYAFDVGYSALAEQGMPGPLPYRLPTNQAFLESAKGLAWCLHELKKFELALAVLDVALRCDPSDPLGVQTWATDWRAEGGST